MTHWLFCGCTLPRQKGSEFGLSIVGCELRRRLDGAASGSQPIGGCVWVLHSYGCVIGPGVAGRGMGEWRNRGEKGVRVSPLSESQGGGERESCLLLPLSLHMERL